MSPRVRRRGAGVLFAVTLVGWPLSLWLASGEPPLVLSLSWLALSLTALDIWATTDVRESKESTDDDG